MMSVYELPIVLIEHILILHCLVFKRVGRRQEGKCSTTKMSFMTYSKNAETLLIQGSIDLRVQGE